MQFSHTTRFKKKRKVIKMRSRFRIASSLILFFCFNLYHPVTAQPSTDGYTCPANQTTYPCETYVFYRARGPDFLDLAAIGDLFSVSRLMISQPSNISFPNSTLIPDQSLFVPIQCSCNRINTSTSISYAGLNYTINAGDTFYLVSTNKFQNLTTYQSVEVVNPTLVPTNLTIGVNVVFPVFCKCPDTTQLQNQVNYLISYVFQPSDSLASVASRFNTTPQAISDVNGNNPQPSDTVFVPVSRLPQLAQPVAPPVNDNSTSESDDDRKAAVIGLAIGLGVCGLFLILVTTLWGYRESLMKKRMKKVDEGKQVLDREGKGLLANQGVNLMADVADYLDKYKVYSIDELMKATDGFDESCLIGGSVYKASIDGDLYAIKKMKWNAYEELKILQKVNHGNLVKLEGFCIDPEEANCYLVYEYVENGSLHSRLHTCNRSEKLNWKTRLRIAIDVANGLQYIHEHTRPRVVHKDIKSSNILLDSNMRAKISDFGLAKSGCNAITMHIVGTQGYMAPEYISDGVVSTKMDIFAFGVVLLELLSSREAVDESGRVLWEEADKIANYKDEDKVEKLRTWVDGDLFKESCSMEGVMNVMAVAVACLQRDPSRRPNMVDIVYALCKSDDFSFDNSDDGLSPRQVLAR